ncbi:DUF1684 domain-containing protein [Pontibacter sp. KCTC 32443]|uniref:DUF1684 domain-containing protein n=1 Tax=Pontibacter TaxID=323449 RepID=UPI00164D0591|nr:MULTISPECIES: DUF1684 domain-containing protein [Pontibacter]MBC5775483.1 DUF1684 domain-containing protein [Pontibacter sp. KCTC 32443]
MKKNLVYAIVLAVTTLFAACTSAPDTVKTSQTDNAAYKASIEEWHKERINNLKKEDGWLALAGLFWLEPGENTFGSAPDNDLVFPEGKIAAKAGTFILADNQVKVKLNDGVEVQLDSKPVQEALVYTSDSVEAPRLKHGPLTWFVIKRGDKYGVRLLDTESEVRTTFKGIDRYEVNPDWKLTARLEPNVSGRKISINNVLGQTSGEETPGALVFTVGGKEYKLDALKEGNQLFVIFADKTNGHETYGAGRYLYTDLPDANGNVTIDFNKAYNPPCAFVTYATCPLPPKQNFLPIPVPVGEKAFEGGY